jgi:hypothetical protein
MATIKEQSAAEPLAIEEQFRRQADAWKAGRGPSSIVADLIAHPAYQQIIAMGRPVVPLILRELEQQPDHSYTYGRESGTRRISRRSPRHDRCLVALGAPTGAALVR